MKWIAKLPLSTVIVDSTIQHKAKSHLVNVVRAFTGVSFDDRSLHEQATVLVQDFGLKPSIAVVDLGYRGVDAENPDLAITYRRKVKSLDAQSIKSISHRAGDRALEGRPPDGSVSPQVRTG